MMIDSKKGYSRLREMFVKKIYANHNDSTVIKNAIIKVLGHISGEKPALNVGAGKTRLHPSIINLDLIANENIDCCADVGKLPFQDESFSLIISQETIEHVEDPFLAIKEMKRVLIRGGYVYLQLPFIIGYHPGPTDYWRFTKEGIKKLIDSLGIETEEIGIAVGPATGFYRIIVEFFAVGMAIINEKLYPSTKAFVAFLIYPVKVLDPIFLKSK